MSRHDPTGTILIRRRFMNQILRRTRDLVKDIVDLIVGLDVFGLAPSREPFTINIEREAWRFLTDERKLVEFQSWFQEQIDLGLLSVDPVTGAPWTAEFVESSYRKGVVDAFNKTRKVAGQEAGFVAGSQAEFLTAAFAAPEAVSKIRLLSTRTFEQLKGITDTMSQGIARELATGLSQGIGPREIARRITQNISGISRRRALVISRTEIINAHAEGSLDAFEKLGVEELNLMSEFSTAGDDRVCPLCAPLEGTVFTIKEARGIIPRHPNCRCAWIPANVGEKDKKGRAVTEEQVKARVEASLKAELPLKAKSRSLRAAKARSTSPLRSVRITKRSPALTKSLGPGSAKSAFESSIVKERRAKAAAKKKAFVPKKPVKPKKPPKLKPPAETALDKDKKALKKLQNENKDKALELRKTESRIETKKKELKSIQDETKKITDKRTEDLKEISDIKKDIKRVESETKRIEKALALEDKGGPPAIEMVKKIEAEKKIEAAAPKVPKKKPLSPLEALLKKEEVKAAKELDELQKLAKEVLDKKKIAAVEGKKEEQGRKKDTASFRTFGNSNSERIEAARWASTQKGYVEWRDGLTENQVNTFSRYTGISAKSINGDLRKGRISSRVTNLRIRTIDNALKKAPKFREDVLLQRGISSSLLRENKGSLVGFRYPDKAFISTSLNKKVAQEFVDNASAGKERFLMTIRVKKGQRAGWLGANEKGNPLSNIAKENEYLLPRDLKFKIVSETVDNKGQTNLIAEIIE